MSSNYQINISHSPPSFANYNQQDLKLFENDSKFNDWSDLNQETANFPLIEDTLNNTCCEQRISSNLLELKKIAQKKKNQINKQEINKLKNIKKVKQPYEINKQRNHSNLKKSKDYCVLGQSQHKINNMFKNISGYNVFAARSNSTTHGSKVKDLKSNYKPLEMNIYSRKASNKLSKSNCFENTKKSPFGFTRQNFKSNNIPNNLSNFQQHRISEMGLEKSYKLSKEFTQPTYYGKMKFGKNSNKDELNFSFSYENPSYFRKSFRSKSCLKENPPCTKAKMINKNIKQNNKFQLNENSTKTVKNTFQITNYQNNLKLSSPKNLENKISPNYLFIKQGKTVSSTMHTFSNENTTLPSNFEKLKIGNLLSFINELSSVEEVHKLLVAMYQREKCVHQSDNINNTSTGENKSLILIDSEITI